MKKRGALSLSLAVLFIGLVLLFQNCNGTRFRTADFNISMGQVQAQIEALSQSSLGTLSTSSQAALNDFFDIASLDGAKIYYSEAPSSMGDINTVMPLDFASFNASTPTYGAAYFAIAQYDDGPRAALIITQIAKDASGNESETPIIALSSSEGGTQDDYDLTLPMLFDGNYPLFLRSADIIDGELSEVVQFEITEPVDEDTEYSFGLINLVEPN